RREAETLRYSLSHTQDDVAFLAALPTDYRITLIDHDGSVLYDSSADAEAMDNHASRPEIVEAFAVGSGEARRRSTTLAEETWYYAIATQDGQVLRIATNRATMMGMCMQVLPMLVGLLLLVLLGMFLLSERLTAWIVRPVNTLNLDAPLENEAYDELSPLLTRMDHQRREIRSQMQQLIAARNEIEAITGQMQEGLILLNQQGDVLSMNNSAAAIFDVEAAACAGDSFLTVVRDPELYDAVTKARQGENAQANLEREGRHYSAFTSPVIQEGAPHGVVVLLLDVTESYTAEISRREFTANVSHELKTPLTAISGYAEIIRDGVAKPEDVPGFAGRICKECNRMIALLGDIFELARLDERKGLGDKEALDLAACAREAASRLESAAEQKDVALSLHCDAAPVTGYRALLTEMCFNLLDNAIRYTPAGGQVSMTSGVTDGRAFVEVRDNGIGIPEEHQTHIFERFYRVDKSRSKASGGTGLGLAIVKHGALIHSAEIILESQVGQGTRIGFRFPG
ncbi:MAG: ATP-binding protein, partial [Clostridiales bacterium]|nr:ATP-binding protein [Clostridiales bacterium]